MAVPPADSATIAGVIQALVLDFDGTILDTEEPEYRAWAEVFRTYGIELTIEEWATCIGTVDAFDPLAALAARVAGELDTEEIHRVRRARNRELLAPTTPQPGVLAWLDAAYERRLPVAIASSSPPHWIEEHLDRLHLRHRIATIACRDGVLAPKPDPATYLAACERLGVPPTSALAVEDSPHGVAAAVAAGLFTIAVPHGLTRHLDLSAAHHLVESLADLTLEEALALAQARAAG